MGFIFSSPGKWQALREHIVHFPVENPSGFTLKGTNSYLIGKGSTRTIVDPGDFKELNANYLLNLQDYLQ